MFQPRLRFTEDFDLFLRIHRSRTSSGATHTAREPTACAELGWHTNLRKPGWRFYITHSEQPGKSFFLYRDPANAKIVTALDHEWDFRLFRICPRSSFWHSVYSETNRFSLGYMIVRQGER